MGGLTLDPPNRNKAQWVASGLTHDPPPPPTGSKPNGWSTIERLQSKLTINRYSFEKKIQQKTFRLQLAVIFNRFELGD
jgi:hypothetical protein